MARKSGYRGTPKQFITPIRARDVVGGKAPGVAGTRENHKLGKNASMPGTFKSPGVNGGGWADSHHTAYHANAGIGWRKKP